METWSAHPRVEEKEEAPWGGGGWSRVSVNSRLQKVDFTLQAELLFSSLRYIIS